MLLLSRPGLGDLVKKELKGKNFLNIEPHSEKLRIQFKPFHTVSLYLSASESLICRNGPHQVGNGKGTDNSPQILFYLCKLMV